MTTRTSTKLFIPQPAELNCSIAGVLEQLDPQAATQGRKIALILHGAAGHKDYLFQKLLASRLPTDSFRFDFRGNFETPGTWRQGDLLDDKDDLIVVVEFLKRQYGYVIDLIVGHSRGSAIAFNWLCTNSTADARTVTGFINVSCRYRMNLLPTAAAMRESFKVQGFYTMTATVARKRTSFKIFPEDLEQFESWDTSIVWDHFPPYVDVLTIHGLSDQVVPPYDAIIYTKALSTRTPGTHNLHLVEGADHNFTGRQDEVVTPILEWLSAKDRGDLKSGVWRAGLRGKL